MAELILALDLPDPPSAIALLDQLPEACPVKVGSVLFTRAGSGFVRGLVDAGHPVFLDLKWHDIPNTVAGAVSAAVSLGVDMVTVHALGGEAMLRAAVESAGDTVRVIAVTVLTSHAAPEYAALVGRGDVDLGVEAARLGELAIAAGVAGLVCSGEELSRMRSIAGPRRLVVPGVRRADDPTGDQQRITTPEAAIAAGATHLVVGRPILHAKDPAAAYADFQRAVTQAP